MATPTTTTTTTRRKARATNATDRFVRDREIGNSKEYVRSHKTLKGRENSLASRGKKSAGLVSSRVSTFFKRKPREKERADDERSYIEHRADINSEWRKARAGAVPVHTTLLTYNHLAANVTLILG